MGQGATVSERTLHARAYSPELCVCECEYMRVTQKLGRARKQRSRGLL